jgi:4a-hydroxytetrahydrobiopterin dehydratase
MTKPLLEQRCLPLEGQPAFTPAQIESHLSLMSGWAMAGSAIEKTFRFADYPRTMAFANAVALIAQAEDHHPEMQVAWGRVTVRFDTHSVGGISINDFICAAKVDALVP